MNKNTKISIIGAGFVGSSIAFAIMNGGLASEIIIVDVNRDKAEGETMDLAHGAAFVKPVDIRSGDYKDTKNSDIIIITAGAAQKQGETRLDLITKNYNIFKSITPEVVKYNPNAILLVVSNPVDVLTYITYKFSGFPKERVIGSGTVLDTSRFRYMLSEHFEIDTRNIHTYIMGEHGDSEIATWSLTNIAGMDVNEYCKVSCKKCDGSLKYEIYKYVKNAAYEIIKKKGATYYAVSLAVRRIVEAILRDENSILTTSSFLDGQYNVSDIYIGVPSIIGSTGVKRILEVPLNTEEKLQFQNSAKELKESLNSINICI